MVLPNKWHSLISGKICLRGQLVGGHHTRSEPPGCSGRTRKEEKEAEQAWNFLYLLESLSPHWRCLMWKTSLKFGLWSALSYFCPSWAISVCVCVCCACTGLCDYLKWFRRPFAKAVWQILFHPQGIEVSRQNGKSITSIEWASGWPSGFNSPLSSRATLPNPCYHSAVCVALFL